MFKRPTPQGCFWITVYAYVSGLEVQLHPYYKDSIIL